MTRRPPAYHSRTQSESEDEAWGVEEPDMKEGEEKVEGEASDSVESTSFVGDEGEEQQ